MQPTYITNGYNQGRVKCKARGNQIIYKSVVTKFGQLPPFHLKQVLNPQHKDYQSGALVHCANEMEDTHICIYIIKFYI